MTYKSAAAVEMAVNLLHLHHLLIQLGRCLPSISIDYSVVYLLAITRSLY